MKFTILIDPQTENEKDRVHLSFEVNTPSATGVYGLVKGLIGQEVAMDLKLIVDGLLQLLARAMVNVQPEPKAEPEKVEGMIPFNKGIIISNKN